MPCQSTHNNYFAHCTHVQLNHYYCYKHLIVRETEMGHCFLLAFISSWTKSNAETLEDFPRNPNPLPSVAGGDVGISLVGPDARWTGLATPPSCPIGCIQRHTR